MREISQDTFVNVMRQYRPEGAILEGLEQPEDEVVQALRRRPRPAELLEARRATRAAGLHRLDV